MFAAQTPGCGDAALSSRQGRQDDYPFLEIAL
jgi:hypothetical protein